MVLLFVMGASPVTAAASGGHAMHHAMIAAVTPATGALALGIHTLTYLIVMALMAWVVYWKLGLRLLRTAWFNLDWLWAAALVVTGVIVLVV